MGIMYTTISWYGSLITSYLRKKYPCWRCYKANDVGHLNVPHGDDVVGHIVGHLVGVDHFLDDTYVPTGLMCRTILCYGFYS